jgi:hypothetical protein
VSTKSLEVDGVKVKGGLTIDNHSNKELGTEDITTGARQQFEKVAQTILIPQPRRRDNDALSAYLITGCGTCCD